MGEIRRIIASSLDEVGGAPSGSLRRVRGGSGQQFKIGKVEDENMELSTIQVDEMFPGATEAWAEVVPDLFPDYPFADDPKAVLMHSLWFKIGPQLRVAFTEMPQMELATWDEDRDDWFPIDNV